MHVVIRATPPQAQLLLDGGKVGNPFDASFPRGDVRHELTVKAPGHRTETQWITFEVDRTLDVALQKGSGTHRVAALPTPPSKTPSPVAAVKPPETRPAEAKPPESKPADGKPVYKGTKGKLITEFPSE